MHLYGPQHPDNPLMEEAVDEVVKRFHVQMDHIPRISLYDSDKGVALENLSENTYTLHAKKLKACSFYNHNIIMPCKKYGIII